jgi:hypothetical protein
MMTGRRCDVEKLRLYGGASLMFLFVDPILRRLAIMTRTYGAN